MAQKVKKIAYIQGWGSFSNETLVCVGMNRQEIGKFMKKNKLKSEFISNFSSKTAAFDKHIGDDSDDLPRVFYDNGRTILSFGNWKNDWEHWDSLNHEICHLVHAILGHHKNMMDEDEGRAYQHEFLFREIRRKLWDLTGK